MSVSRERSLGRLTRLETGTERANAGKGYACYESRFRVETYLEKRDWNSGEVQTVYNIYH